MAATDVAQLAELEKNIFSVPWSEKAFAALMDSPVAVCVVAQEQERIVGCACMTVLSDEADIDKVMVHASFRGQHIAEEMLEALFEIGSSRGVLAYTLEVRVSNEAAIGLYRKKGFEGEGVRPGFYDKPSEDALIMWKRQ